MDACNEGDERMLADPQMQEAFRPGDLCDADGGEKLDGRTGRRLETRGGGRGTRRYSVRPPRAGRRPRPGSSCPSRAKRDRRACTASTMFSGGSEKTCAVVTLVGTSVDLGGRAELGHASLVEGRRVAAEQQRLGRLGRGIDEDGARLGEDARQFLAQLLAQLVVEIGERLVEQHKVGPLDEGARDRGALLLPAGELQRPAVEEGLELEELRGLGDAFGRSARQAARRRATARRCSRRPKATGS